MLYMDFYEYNDLRYLDEKSEFCLVFKVSNVEFCKRKNLFTALRHSEASKRTSQFIMSDPNEALLTQFQVKVVVLLYDLQSIYEPFVTYPGTD